MAQTLTYNARQLIQLGLVWGLNISNNIEQPEVQTVSAAPILQSSMPDPFEELFGRYDNDPSWEDFPRWLKEYRASIKERDVVPQE